MLYSICMVLAFTVSVKINAELYSSIAELEGLLVTQKRTINDLELYVQRQEEILSIIKRYLHNFKTHHDKAMEDIPNYMGNPINAFTLIKRLTIDLNYLNSGLKIGEEHFKNISKKQEDVLYPDMADLEGAANALVRLQKVYRLDVKQLAKGNLNGVAYSAPMSASDCYELGRALYNVENYKNARAWMVEALEKYHKEKIPYPFTDYDILDYVHKTCHQLEYSIEDLDWLQRVTFIAPGHPELINIIEYYLKEAGNKNKKFSKTTINQDTEDFEFEAMCRGELGVPIEVSSRLKCRYLFENHPFLTIAPFKIEMLYHKPDVMLFHDVLSDNEMETIKQMARPKLERAQVIDIMTGKPINTIYRISKSSFLQDLESPTIARISQRVKHMTGLSLQTAEDLLVLNYGTGGHYSPHYDFLKNMHATDAVDDIIEHVGDRMATVLFYISDVTQGGATVFTNLGVSVAPVKGTAIFFSNLVATGWPDYSTKHGACPVLQGSKWVATKWLHQVGQELLKPCNSKPQKSDFISNVPSPVVKTQ